MFEKSNDFLRRIWHPRPLIVAGGYSPEAAYEVAEAEGDLIAFGRYFISNVSLSAPSFELVMPTDSCTFHSPTFRLASGRKHRSLNGTEALSTPKVVWGISITLLQIALNPSLLNERERSMK